MTTLTRPTVFSLAVCAMLPACAQDDTAPSDQVCNDAIALVTQCNGTTPTLPAEGCVGEFRTASEDIVAGGCAALSTAGGKSDTGGFWCWPVNRWLGLCNDEVSLSDAGALPTLTEVCPSFRSDDLCDALRSAEVSGSVDDYDIARLTIVSRVESEDRNAVLTDEAVRYYIRERVISLLVYNIISNHGAITAEPADYSGQVDELLQEHAPAYDTRDMRMARSWMPPQPGETECTSSAAAVMYPGVVRLLNRDEWEQQQQALATALPCLVHFRVESGSFIDPDINAQQGKALVDEIDATLGQVPLHLMGYSQGSTNVLRTLVDFPDVAARTRSVLTLHSAARGSEVGDLLYNVVEALDVQGTICTSFPEFARPTCEWAANLSPRPADFLLDKLALALGVPIHDLETFIQQEDGIDAAPTKRAFFKRHLKGIKSLTTAVSQKFWEDRSSELPKNTLYMSFRTAITRELANLPPSNALFHALLERAGDSIPYNDMQVLVQNQSLGGDIADLEVTSPIFEGNHWQWVLYDGAVPDTIMARDMTERTPHRSLLVAYYQTLNDVGLLFDQ